MDLNMIKETELELKLKKYFNELKMFYGEEVIETILLSKKSITASLEMVGIDLDDITDKQVNLILLKNAILSSKVNTSFLSEFGSEDKELYFNDTLDLIQNSKVQKKKLIRNFIETSQISNENLLKKNKDVKNILISLELLNSYIQEEKVTKKVR